MASSSNAAAPASSESLSPIVLDLGKHKRKAIKRLQRGQGRLLEEALSSIQEMQRAGTIPSAVQPVILVVRQKSRNQKLFPFIR
jgi:hypothetical protein